MMYMISVFMYIERLFQTFEQTRGFVFDLPILWRPVLVDRRVEHFLQRRASCRLAAVGQQQFGQKEMGRGILVVVFQRLTQVPLRLLVAAAEQPGHFEVPAAERAVGGSLLKRGIDPQDGFERLFDRAAVLEALAQAVRLGERAHVRGGPEVACGSVRIDRWGLAPRRDALLWKSASFAARGMAAKPAVRPRELPR